MEFLGRIGFALFCAFFILNPIAIAETPCSEIAEWISNKPKTKAATLNHKSKFHSELIKELRESERDLIKTLSAPHRKTQRLILLGEMAKERFGYEPFFIFQLRGLKAGRAFLTQLGLIPVLKTNLHLKKEAMMILSDHKDFFEKWSGLAKKAAQINFSSGCESIKDELKSFSKKTPQPIIDWVGS